MSKDAKHGGVVAVPRLQRPQPRIVQFKNRRYSIRLEPVFWQALESQAKRQGMRLGKYIGHLAEAFEGNNFSSHLRVLSMLESERTIAQANLPVRRAGLLDLVLTAFEPGLVLSRYRTIIAYNAGFLAWLGREFRPAVGSDLTSVFQVRTRRPLNELWLDLIAGTVVSADINILHVQPGRVLAAPARLVALPAASEGEFYGALWISTRRRGGVEPSARQPARGTTGRRGAG